MNLASNFRLGLRALLLALVMAMQAAVAARITQPVDDHRRTELAGHVHRALAQSRDLGPADPAARLERVMLVLRAGPEQEAALDDFLRSVQTPRDPAYRHWLTPADFAARFGVAAADRAVVKRWLQGHGLRIDDEPAGGRLIVFSGSIAQVSDAFGVRMRQVDWHGQRHLANANNPSVPSALAGVVAGLASLHDFRHRPQLVRGQSAPQWNTGSANYLAPSDFAVIYGLAASYTAGLTGTGRSIAVLGRSDVVAADLSTFQADFGVAGSAQQVIHNGAAPGLVADDETESDLDLEWASAVAPGATVKFVTSASTRTSDGIDLSASYAVANNVADIISLSYGSCESATDFSAGSSPLYHQLWQQAAAQGISVFVSSGDSGAAGCDVSSAAQATGGQAVNKLCSSPYSTCVGGTEFVADAGAAQSSFWTTGSSGLPATQATALSYIGEAVWNQSGAVTGGAALYASGGGASTYFAKPAWQYAAGVPADGRRDVPDVALTAASNHDAYLIFSSDGHAGTTLEAIGGTSASTPAFAGIAALVAQSEGQRLGDVNPVLYALSNLQAAGGATVFHRITSGDNSVPGQAGFAASTGHPGYSQASGLGSVDGGQLVAHWGDVQAAPTGLAPSFVVLPASASVGAATLTVASTTAWTAAVSGSTGWLTVTPASGTGGSGLSFSAAANTGAAARSATVTVAGQAMTVTQAAGSSTSAQLLASSTGLAFGSGTVGVAGPAQRLQIGNVGGAALVLASVATAGGQADDFATSGSCAGGLSLPPGAACYLDLSFTPGAAGPRAATLQVASNDAASPLAVSLTGTGAGATGVVAVPVPAWAQAALAAGLLLALRRAGLRRPG